MLGGNCFRGVLPYSQKMAIGDVKLCHMQGDEMGKHFEQKYTGEGVNFNIISEARLTQLYIKKDIAMNEYIHYKPVSLSLSPKP